MDKRFLRIEEWTIGSALLLAGFVGCVAILLIASGDAVAGGLTLVGDIASLVALLIRRSYFIDKLITDEDAAQRDNGEGD